MARFQSVLVANRGEIACRIIKTVNTLGLRSIAVYSTADRDAPHVKLADDAVCIGDPPVHQSYLDGEKIIQACRRTGAQAVHPGYGFLSENAAFAEAVTNNNLTYIGPTAKSIAAMGNKAEAKRMMQSANVACVPGYEGEDQSLQSFVEAAGKIGFPIMVKAAAGGGGRGMRLVANPEELKSAIAIAAGEAENAFGSSQLILEKAIIRPRHVEIQIIADQHGNCISLGERDCSVQRRHQKIIEEAPCPVMNDDLRKRMGASAVAAAKSVDYVGAGTVEFLLDEKQQFYFLEMNTRLQVEHPVTELVTGLDLVELQILVARGEPLPLSQEDLEITGHAIEVRLYAEDPAADFLPSTGLVELWQPPNGTGIRVDGGICSGAMVSPHYDPMLAKIIAHGSSREIARTRLVKALKKTVLFGLKHNREFLIDSLESEAFVEGTATTDFVAKTYPKGYVTKVPEPTDVAIAAALTLRSRQIECFQKSTVSAPELLGWSSTNPLAIPLTLTWHNCEHDLSVSVSGQIFEVGVTDETHDEGLVFIAVTMDEVTENFARVSINDVVHQVMFSVGPDGYVWTDRNGHFFCFGSSLGREGKETTAFGNVVNSPMPGNVVEIHVSPGQWIKAGETLMVIEAMKMQHPVKMTKDARIKTVLITAGDQVRSGDLLVELEETE